MKLHAARERWKVTQERMAEIFGGVNLRTYRRWERQEQDIPPAARTLLKILVASPEARKIVGLPA